MTKSLLQLLSVFALCGLLALPVAAQGIVALDTPIDRPTIYPSSDTREGSDVIITHSFSEEISPSGLACGGDGFVRENSHFRVFNLQDFSIEGDLVVNAADIGVAFASAPTDVRVVLYTLSGPLQMSNLSVLSLQNYVQEVTSGELVHYELDPVTVPAGSVLVFEWTVSDGADEMINTRMGSNDAGASGPTYIMSSACDLFEPTDTASIGFPNTHWVLNIYGKEISSSNEGNSEFRDVVLGQNAPNPFFGTTNITFDIPVAEQVVINVFDLTGRKVAEVVNEHYSAGSHTVRFDGNGLASGMYVYQLRAGNMVQTKRFTVVN